jgi:hypothetical protein
MRTEWAVEKVIEMAGIPLDNAGTELIRLARDALDRCYYLDRSAEWLLKRLNTRYRHLN